MLRRIVKFFSNVMNFTPPGNHPPTAGGQEPTISGHGNPTARLSLSLVEDCSGSMDTEGKIDKAKKASIDLVDSLEDREVEIGLVSFGGRVDLETDLMQNFSQLKDAIRRLRAGGNTPFLKAMQVSISSHLEFANGERVLVMDTDGRPSFAGKDEILQLGTSLKEKGVRIVTIGIGEDVNSQFLRRLASTPEDYYFAQAPEDISGVFETVTGSLVRKADS